VQRLLFSTHYVDLSLLALLLLLPAVILLAWFHGKPGRDRDSLAKTEKIGIPANLALCGIVLWAVFAGRDLGRMTTAVTTTDEEGQGVEWGIVKPEFRKSVALFPLDLGPGIGENLTWLAYAVPLVMELDLLADDFFIGKGGLLDRREVLFRDRLAERGFADLRGVPLTLKREIGDEAHAEFLTEGEVDHDGDLYRAVLRVYRVDDGSLEGETVHEDADLLALVDELSVSVKRAVGIPPRADVEDIPVRQRLSEDDVAVETTLRSLEAAFVRGDLPAAIELTSAATARDPTFTTSQYILSLFLQLASQRGEAIARMQAAIEHEHRLPERVRLGVRADYYALLGDWERMAAVLKMLTELSPHDLLALVSYKEALDALGDKEGVLATLEAMRDLEPRNGDLLQEIARVHEDMGDDEQAIAGLTDYTESFPDDPGGYARLAAAQKRLGDYEAARDNLETAVLLESFSASLAVQLATLDLDAGNYADAWAGYERALEAARTSEQTAEVLAGIAKYHLRRGELVQAAEVAERLLKEASGNASAAASSTVLGNLLVDALFVSHEEDASTVAEAVGEPDIGRLLQEFTALGSAEAEAASEAELTEALRLVPGDPAAHFELALLLEERDDLDAAVEHLESALAAWENADEDYEPARRARAKLTALRAR
jgi:tetratricopeptide (TPR) repeat protein